MKSHVLSYIYIYLLPFLTSTDDYIIKIGYTGNLTERNLYKEFGLESDEIYLLCGFKITNENIEKHIHTFLRKQYNDCRYPIHTFI